MAQLCDEDAESVLREARLFAGSCQHEYVGVEHILWALAAGSSVSKSFREAGFDPEAYAAWFRQSTGRWRCLAAESLPWSPRAREVISEALQISNPRLTAKSLALGVLASPTLNVERWAGTSYCSAISPDVAALRADIESLSPAEPNRPSGAG